MLSQRHSISFESRTVIRLSDQVHTGCLMKVFCLMPFKALVFSLRWISLSLVLLQKWKAAKHASASWLENASECNRHSSVVKPVSQETDSRADSTRNSVGFCILSAISWFSLVCHCQRRQMELLPSCPFWSLRSTWWRSFFAFLQTNWHNWRSWLTWFC